ncbi:RNA 2',3'-cyclic phosphodiesterase [Halobacillus litoralis]|uniref:RNA 2',3'-cyclic phosphodiesterase n=1 Tax=Halobacillus litoralis TaxID=45668 RepID=UPI001CFDFA75|nr:RNA 2',3'-cyclic phosphodiesterase [Halobacillus litoralis]
MSSHYFIGIKTDQKIADALQEWQEVLSESMSYRNWTNREDFHITLKFLGGTAEEIIDEYIEEIKSQSWPSPFNVGIGPAGSFGERTCPRVFFAEVEKASELMEIKRKIEKTGHLLGIDEESRKYHPHVTLAKQQAEGRSPLSQEHIPVIFQSNYQMKVHAFSVFKIHPGKQPKYEKVADIDLNRKGF